MSSHAITTACPVSGSTDVRPVLAISQVPVLCNVLWPTRDEALRAPLGDIHLAYAPESGHLFNTAFDPAKMTYTQEYENSLHFSPRFQQFAEALADRLVDTYDLHGKHIIELGSGKGDFLHMICARGDNRGVGFDPSYEPEHGPSDARVTFVQDFYGEQYADQQADFIICRHVLEHVEFPREFVSSVRRSIGERDTVVYFEVPNAAYTLRDMGIWDLIYEHFSYFTIHSLARLFIECGFEVLSVAETYGGQFLGIEARPAPGITLDPWAPWSDLRATAAHVNAFAEQYRRKVAVWRQTLAGLDAAGRTAVIWGGGSKGVTFLNVLQTAGQIRYVVDINPRKQGRFVGGTGQQMVSADFLTTSRPDVIVVMNPIYRDEIRQITTQLGLDPEFMTV